MQNDPNSKNDHFKSSLIDEIISESSLSSLSSENKNAISDLSYKLDHLQTCETETQNQIKEVLPSGYSLFICCGYYRSRAGR